MSGHRFLAASLVGALSLVAHIARADGDSPTQAVTLTVPENAVRGAVVGVLDLDAVGPRCRCSIVTGNHDSAFAIHDHNGCLTVNNSAALNHEARERFDLVLNVERPATDDPALRAFLNDVIDSGATLKTVEALLTDVEQVRVTILVDDVAEPPVLPPQSATIMVFGSEPVEEAWIGVRDEDRDESLNFEVLAGAPSGWFRIERETGRISIDQPAAMARGDQTFPLTVQVTDSAGLSDATTIALRVIALAGAPSSLIVAAPSAPTPLAVPTEVDPSPVAVDHSGDPADDGAGQTEAIADPPAESIAVIAPAVPVFDAARDVPPVSAATPPGREGDALKAESIGGRLLRMGGIFALLGFVVAVVMAWLKWRTVNDAAELDDDRERLLRLQSISENPESVGVDEVPLPTDTTALEDRVIGQLTDLRQMFAAPTDAPAHDPVTDKAYGAIEITANPDESQRSIDPTDAQSETPDPAERVHSQLTDLRQMFAAPEGALHGEDPIEDEAHGVIEHTGESEEFQYSTDPTEVQSATPAPVGATSQSSDSQDMPASPTDTPHDTVKFESHDTIEHSGNSDREGGGEGEDARPDESNSDSSEGQWDSFDATSQEERYEISDAQQFGDYPETQPAPLQLESGTEEYSFPAFDESAECDPRTDPEVHGPSVLESGPMTSADGRGDAAFSATADAEADSTPDAVRGDSSVEDAADSRINLLRHELAEKFGIALPDATGATESAAAATDSLSSATTDAEPAAVGAESLIEAVTTSATALKPVDESPSSNPSATAPRSANEGSPLTSARFMTDPAPESQAGTSAGSEQPPEPAPVEKEQESAAARVNNKLAMRRELSSLRMVANQHARAIVAKQATQKRTRQTWYKSAGLMVMLNFAAMGLLAGSPAGIVRIIGWGLMLAAATTLAVCLHSFRQMVAGNEAEGDPQEDDGASPADSSSTPAAAHPEAIAAPPTVVLPARELPAADGKSSPPTSEDPAADATADDATADRPPTSRTGELAAATHK